MRRFLILTCLLFLAARPAFADDLQDGMAAYRQKDYPKALLLLRPLADNGNVGAERQVGLMYFWGFGIKKDDQIALKYFISAASQGAVGDQITLAMFYQHDGDNAKELKMEGEFGSASKDYATAREWFEKAMAQGSAEAVRHIADLYNYERGVEQDYKQAAIWYTKAADAGDAQAQYELGVLYKRGLGVETNAIKAHKWLSLAAKTDNKTGKQAAEQRDFLAKNMMPDEVKQAIQLATDWKPVPIAPGTTSAMIAPPPPAAAPKPAEIAAPAPPPPAAAPAPAPAPVAVRPEAPGTEPDANSAPAPGQK